MANRLVQKTAFSFIQNPSHSTHYQQTDDDPFFILLYFTQQNFNCVAEIISQHSYHDCPDQCSS